MNVAVTSEALARVVGRSGLLFFRAFFLTVIDYRRRQRAAAVIDYRRRQRISAGACRYYRRREFSKAGNVLADFL